MVTNYTTHDPAHPGETSSKTITTTCLSGASCMPPRTSWDRHSHQLHPGSLGVSSLRFAAAPHEQPPSLVAAMTTLVFWAVGLREKPSGGWRHQDVSKNLSICITCTVWNNPLLMGRPVGASETIPELISNFTGLWLLPENSKNLVFPSSTPLVTSETPQWGFTLLRMDIPMFWPLPGHLPSQLRATGL